MGFPAELQAKKDPVPDRRDVKGFGNPPPCYRPSPTGTTPAQEKRWMGRPDPHARRRSLRCAPIRPSVDKLPAFDGDVENRRCERKPKKLWARQSPDAPQDPGDQQPVQVIVNRHAGRVPYVPVVAGGRRPRGLPGGLLPGGLLSALLRGAGHLPELVAQGPRPPRQPTRLRSPLGPGTPLRRSHPSTVPTSPRSGPGRPEGRTRPTRRRPPASSLPLSARRRRTRQARGRLAPPALRKGHLPSRGRSARATAQQGTGTASTPPAPRRAARRGTGPSPPYRRPRPPLRRRLYCKTARRTFRMKEQVAGPAEQNRPEEHCPEHVNPDRVAIRVVAHGVFQKQAEKEIEL